MHPSHISIVPSQLSVCKHQPIGLSLSLFDSQSVYLSLSLFRSLSLSVSLKQCISFSREEKIPLPTATDDGANPLLFPQGRRTKITLPHGQPSESAPPAWPSVSDRSQYQCEAHPNLIYQFTLHIRRSSSPLTPP